MNAIKTFGQKLRQSKELPLEELQEIWEDNEHGEYIQINDAGGREDGIVNYIAHGSVMEEICGRYVERRSFDKQGHSILVKVEVDDKIRFAEIKRWCDKNGYWPNIWSVNDHGNVSLYTNTGRYMGALV